jgi:hypothetical protein
MAHLQPRRIARHGSSLGDELWVVNQVVHPSRGGASRTMLNDVLAAIDNEIVCLEQAKALLSASGAVVAKRKPGRLAKTASVVAPKVQKAESAAR